MAVYVIGDVQGCYGPLQKLLCKIDFEPRRDHLWFVGDLVNRGPESLEVVRFVRGLGSGAQVVLGNHDLNLLAVSVGARPVKTPDTLTSFLAASDRDELLDWLRFRPLLHHDVALGVVMVHAGVDPAWSLSQSKALAGEVEAVLQANPGDFLRHMYGDQPDRWRDSLSGWARLRCITNIFTRMRYCDRNGRIDVGHAGPPGTQPPSLRPWFDWPRQLRGARLVFGHWSTLGARSVNEAICLDSGCVWGRRLTSVRLDSTEIQFDSVACGSS